MSTTATHQVLIVGGGTAGITVAARLLRKGYTDVAIIELAGPGRIGLAADRDAIVRALAGLPRERLRIALEGASASQVAALTDGLGVSIASLGVDPLGTLARTGDPSGLDAGGTRIDVELRQVVQHIQEDFADLDELGLVDRARPVLPIVVAAHDRDGGHRAQSGQDFGVPDVPGMHDVVAAGEKIDRLRAQQPMRVRNQSDPCHRLGAYREPAKLSR